MQNSQSIYTLHTYHTPQFLSTGEYGLFQVRSLYIPTKDRAPFTGPFLGVPSLLITLQNGQIHLSIEAQCDHHNYKMAYLHFLHVIKFHPLPDRGMGSSIFAFLHPRSCS